MTYTLIRRKKTPGGNCTKVEYFPGVPDDEVMQRLSELFETSCWLYAENDDLKFNGQNPKKNAQEGPKKASR